MRFWTLLKQIVLLYESDRFWLWKPGGHFGPPAGALGPCGPEGPGGPEAHLEAHLRHTYFSLREA